jgi:hypothetical protein
MWNVPLERKANVSVRSKTVSRLKHDLFLCACDFVERVYEMLPNYASIYKNKNFVPDLKMGCIRISFSETQLVQMFMIIYLLRLSISNYTCSYVNTGTSLKA